MKQTHSSSRDGPLIYQITVQGCLDEAWSTWFDGLTIQCQGDGKTLIAGAIADQPALHGVLKRIRDLGMPLLTVRQLDEDESTKMLIQIRESKMRVINSEELKAKLDRGDDVKLIMTLNEWAYRAKHIPGSIYVASQEQAQGLLQPDDEIIVYCTNPACSASIMAYEALHAQGFTNIARYAGGIQAWEEAGYPVVDGAN